MLAEGVGLRTTYAILHTRLTIHKTGLLRRQPEVGHLIGRHTEVAVHHRLAALGSQSPAHRHIRLVIEWHIGNFREQLLIVFDDGHVLGFAVVLDPVVVRGVPDSIGLFRLFIRVHFWTRDKDTGTGGQHFHSLLLCLHRKASYSHQAKDHDTFHISFGFLLILLVCMSSSRYSW